MLNHYIIKNCELYLLSEAEISSAKVQPVWIDIIDPTEAEKELLENLLNIKLAQDNKILLKKLPGHFFQKRGEVYVTINIVKEDATIEVVTVILTKDKLITLRSAGVPANKEYLSHLAINFPQALTPNNIFAYCLESRTMHISENLASIGNALDNISYDIFYPKNRIKKYHKIPFNKYISLIGQNGHLISKNYESLNSMHQALVFIIGSEQFKVSSAELEKINDLISEISALEDEISFLNEKIDFLLNICFGMIGFEQSTISKVLSIAALVFLPPTAIAGIYGMNFHNIPMSNWEYGFEISIVIIILSATIPYLLCKLRNWV